MKTHLLFDFETLSNDSLSAAAIDCSVLVFDWDRFTSDKPYTLRDIEMTRRFKLSVADQIENYDFTVSKDTIEFWARQNADVRSKIVPKADDLKLEDFVSSFHDMLINSPKIEYWWSRSNTFDPIILSHLFKAANKRAHMDEYLKFWRIRDVRTWIDAKLDFPKKNAFTPIEDTDFWDKVFKEHDSTWDVFADMLRFQALARAEADMEGIMR